MVKRNPMISRRKIGLLFLFDESWTGGYYYVVNIINALNLLPEIEKPELTIFYRDKAILGKANVNYPYLKTLPVRKELTFIARVVTKLRRLILDKSYYPQYADNLVDFVFPSMSVKHTKNGSLRRFRMIYWIPDFQHKQLPHFFSEKDLSERDKTFAQIAGHGGELVLSSENALQDFRRYFPDAAVKTTVMRFASVLPDYSGVEAAEVLRKYQIATPYFISPNQFWAHKNHIVVMKAALQLKKKGKEIVVCFTGKEEDYRNPGYFQQLKDFVTRHGLTNNIRFLGFIDRKEQLQLMNHAIAVVQPSLFEGWSTVIEDSKAMDQSLIVSDLAVHREQCGEKAFYFQPNDEFGLSEILEKFMAETVARPRFFYEDTIKQYARQLINL